MTSDRPEFGQPLSKAAPRKRQPKPTTPRGPDEDRVDEWLEQVFLR